MITNEVNIANAVDSISDTNELSDKFNLIPLDISFEGGMVGISISPDDELDVQTECQSI